MPGSRETTAEILNAQQSVVHVPVSDKIGFWGHVAEMLNTRQSLVGVCIQLGFPETYCSLF